MHDLRRYWDANGRRREEQSGENQDNGGENGRALGELNMLMSADSQRRTP